MQWGGVDDTSLQEHPWESPEFQEVCLKIKALISAESAEKLPSIDMFINDVRGDLSLILPKDKSKKESGMDSWGVYIDHSDEDNGRNYHLIQMNKILKGAGMTLDEFLDIMHSAPLPEYVHAEAVRGEAVLFERVKVGIFKILDGAKGLGQENPKITLGETHYSLDGKTQPPLTNQRDTFGKDVIAYYKRIGKMFFANDEAQMRQALLELGNRYASCTLPYKKLQEALLAVVQRTGMNADEFLSYIASAEGALPLRKTDAKRK